MVLTSGHPVGEEGEELGEVDWAGSLRKHFVELLVRHQLAHLIPDSPEIFLADDAVLVLVHKRETLRKEKRDETWSTRWDRRLWEVGIGLVAWDWDSRNWPPWTRRPGTRRTWRKQKSRISWQPSCWTWTRASWPGQRVPPAQEPSLALVVAPLLRAPEPPLPLPSSSSWVFLFCRPGKQSPPLSIHPNDVHINGLPERGCLVIVLDGTVRVTYYTDQLVTFHKIQVTKTLKYGLDRPRVRGLESRA